MINLINYDQIIEADKFTIDYGKRIIDTSYTARHPVNIIYSELKKVWNEIIDPFPLHMTKSSSGNMIIYLLNGWIMYTSDNFKITNCLE